MFRPFALAAALATGTALSAPTPTTSRDAAYAVVPPVVTVYKSKNCQCCQRWVDHLRDAGFKVDIHAMEDLTEIKKEAGVPDSLRSCHTALVGGYAIEGHVPADLVQRLLKEKPKVAGIAVPGMPMGSPGMEMGEHKDAYEVLTFTHDGRTTVYAKR